MLKIFHNFKLNVKSAFPMQNAMHLFKRLFIFSSHGIISFIGLMKLSKSRNSKRTVITAK